MLASSSDSNVSDSSSEDDISEDELLPEGDHFNSIKFLQMKHVKDDGLLIVCDSTTDAGKFKDLASQHLSGEYEVKEVRSFNKLTEYKKKLLETQQTLYDRQNRHDYQYLEQRGMLIACLPCGSDTPVYPFLNAKIPYTVFLWEPQKLLITRYLTISSVKKCYIPNCRNTTNNRVLVSVSRDFSVRRIWWELVHGGKPLEPHSGLFCCEDHFDISFSWDVPADFENWHYFEMIGGTLRLKKGVLPHKYIDEPEGKLNESALTDSAKKRRLENIDRFQASLTKNNTAAKSRQSIGLQVHLKGRNTQTKFISDSVAPSPMKQSKTVRLDVNKSPSVASSQCDSDQAVNILFQLRFQPQLIQRFNQLEIIYRRVNERTVLSIILKRTPDFIYDCPVSYIVL
nr:unnamed protein product [Callosobruchus analis]